MHPPSDAIIAVTQRCNARCVMCNVWKSEQPDRLEPEHLGNLPVSLRTVNLSGGEPFLRDDLPEFVRAVRTRCPGVRITLSTNATLPDHVAETMKTLRGIDPSIRLAVSLDGLGEVHDRIRGVPGAFDKAIDLIERLKADGYNGLRVSMTLTRENLDQLAQVAELCDRLDLELGVVAAHAADTHLGVETEARGRMPEWLGEVFETTVRRWLRSWRPKQWLRAHFAWGTYRFMIDQPWEVSCRAGRDFFFVQSDGEVYHCSVQGQSMGNLIDEPWAEIWNGPSAVDARRSAANCPRRCWMICTVRGLYRHGWIRIPLWIARHKLQAHLDNLRTP